MTDRNSRSKGVRNSSSNKNKRISSIITTKNPTNQNSGNNDQNAYNIKPNPKLKNKPLISSPPTIHNNAPSHSNYNNDGEYNVDNPFENEPMSNYNNRNPEDALNNTVNNNNNKRKSKKIHNYNNNNIPKDQSQRQQAYQKYQSYSLDSENSKSNNINNIDHDEHENIDNNFRIKKEIDNLVGNNDPYISTNEANNKNRRNTLVSAASTTGMGSETVEMNVLNSNNDNNKPSSYPKHHRPRPNYVANNNSSNDANSNNNTLQVPQIRTTLATNNGGRDLDNDRHYNHYHNYNNIDDNNNDNNLGHDLLKPELGHNHPRRQKSLIKPERARRNQRRISRGVTNFNHFAIGNNVDRWSILPPNAENFASGNVSEIGSNNGNGDDGGDERRLSRPLDNRRLSIKDESRKRKWYKCQCLSTWLLYANCITFWAPPSLLSCFGMHDRLVQRAWREKMALVSIILVLCLTVGFLTFGFSQTFCGKPPVRIRVGGVSLQQAVVLGRIYDLSNYAHIVSPPDIKAQAPGNLLHNAVGGKDVSFMFQRVKNACEGFLLHNTDIIRYFPCNATDDFTDPAVLNNSTTKACHPPGNLPDLGLENLPYVGDVFFDWEDVQRDDQAYIVHNGHVLDMGKFDYLLPNIQMSEELKNVAVINMDSNRGRDMTYYFRQNEDRIKLSRCLEETVKVGVVDFNSIGCMITDVVTYVSLVVIVGVVLVRFALAVLFGWILSWRLGSFREETAEEIASRERDIEKWSNENVHHSKSPANNNNNNNNKGSFKFLSTSRYSTQPPGVTTYDRNRRTDNRSTRMYSMSNGNGSGHLKETDSGGTSRRSSNDGNHARTDSMSSATSSLAQTSSFQQLPQDLEQRYNFPPMHTILLVTCYSEGEEGLRTTLDSLANTDYSTSHKLIMMIADGIITGSGNDKSTPDICLSLMSDFFIQPELVQAHSYVAIADGKKRHNMAKVYAGYYKYKDSKNKTRRIPVVTIVKCGGPGEQDDKKPGNRGKRDSQIILMGFLQKVMFNERMTPLEYEFFNAIRNVSGVTPDFFELVLMVDADTKIYPDSLTRMVACMSRDPTVMGLCGETKIANKTDSWVTAIQVFEYYINHHMQKAFESIFGGVTCLPGCFCMYRIKAPKGPSGYWVPILANPDIVEQYSENIVDTLHKKNLLLLGEDRYLTTLMLKTFPKRKMLFVPQAVCKTIVPDTFFVLRSQRRRWINSTVHNLLELVLIPDLCGTFCFSMQFVIFMELVGTVVLPAAITFTMYLVIISFFTRPIPVIPLLLLAAILGLPAVLIMLTTRKVVYVGWMLIYLFSLPVWNFILPLYAFWHFDDFSWGQTRMVEGEIAGEDHSRKEGVFDSSRIVMRRWAEWEREKQLKIRSSQLIPYSTVQMSPEENFNGFPSSATTATTPTTTTTSRPSSLHTNSRPTSIASSIYDNKSYLQMAPPPIPPIPPSFNPRSGVSKRTSTRPRADSLMIPPPLAGSTTLGNNNISNSPTSSLMSTPVGSARNSSVSTDDRGISLDELQQQEQQGYLDRAHGNVVYTNNRDLFLDELQQQQQQQQQGRLNNGNNNNNYYYDNNYNNSNSNYDNGYYNDNNNNNYPNNLI